MATSTMRKVLISIFVISLLATIVIDTAEARRGGGGRGGGSRGRGSSRSKTKSRGGGGGVTNAKNYKNVALSGRIVKGSSPYTKSTWRRAAAGGLIFGGALYLMRPRHHPMYNQMPIICTNRNFENGGKRYEHFICPLPDTNDTLKYCCGREREEYCCDKETAQKYYAEHHKSSGSSPVGMIIGLLVLILVICGIVYCCKKNGSGSLTKMFKSKRSARDQDGITLSSPNKHVAPADFEPPSSSMPLNGEDTSHNASYPQGAPDYPPPYNASPAGYGGGSGLPYAPPPAGGFAAPYPPAGVAYPPPQGPGAPTPYPPPSGGPGITPYPPAPMPGEVPYPVGSPSYPPYPGGDGGVPAPPYPGAPPPGAAPSYDSHSAYPPYGPPSQTKA